MKIYDKLTELIGNTPMLEVPNTVHKEGASAHVLVKVEGFNPGGSVKDRVALAMIEDAEHRGILHPGATIIEPTSGNTGIGLAWIGTSKGYKVVLTMPDTMSSERRSLLKAYGANIELTPGAKGMSGAIERAQQLADATVGAVILGQFSNPANPEVHRRTTGPEILHDTDGHVDIFVAGVGSGGTITGVGRALKAFNENIQIVAVEPAASAVISGGKAGAHRIQGIGAGFIPDNYDASVVDTVIAVSDDDAISTARALADNDGILAGISSGAALYAALQLAKVPSNKGKTIVALLPDTGERYLSLGVF